MASLHTAATVSLWLQSKGCTVSIQETRNASMLREYIIHYTLAAEVAPQPPIQIKHDNRVVFPDGTQLEVLMSFYENMGGE